MGKRRMRILAIDPGNVESGFALIEMPNFKLIDFGKKENEALLELVRGYFFDGWERVEKYLKINKFAIEMIASYGMPVGKDVFETCVWIGQLKEAITREGEDVAFIYRKEEKIALCGSLKAKDTNIRQALIDRYAKFDFKTGKGTKNNQDTFYGVSKDAWQAIAVGVTYWEEQCKN